ncbi:MAG: serine hydrolase [Syntrophobacteraceae bacterium]|nr:serine hydrolase [Syntrophobacteraceae bacterium]
MRGKGQFVWFFFLFSLCSFIPQISHAWEFKHVNARSAVLYDMSSGKVLYEQDADSQIPPASLTKILSLYLTFEAIESGQISLYDKVRVSSHAASMPKVRMGLRTGDIVTVAQLIRGMAVESGNDAAAAMAEHISGSVPSFVAKMNAKARELGMTSSRFMTPNGLPAPGQLTTARDILKLSIAYLRRFPEALAISSLRSYTYRGKTDHNPNNLLGRCPGVDGLKTGFVCASGFNISATAMRDHTRMIAVVLGSRNPGIRCIDTENLLEEGYRTIGGTFYTVGAYPHMAEAEPEAGSCKPRVARRGRTRSARLAARTRTKHAAKRHGLKATTGYAARACKSRVRVSRAEAKARHANSSPPAKRIARKRLAACQKKGAPPHSAKTAKRTTSHGRVVSKSPAKTRKLAKAVCKKKTVRASSTKVSAKAKTTRKGKPKSVVRKRNGVKTATKKRRHCARNIRNDIRQAG